MKNLYITKMIELAKIYLDAGQSHKERVAKLEKANEIGTISPIDYKAQQEALTAEAAESRTSFAQDIDTVLSEYAERVNLWAQLRGEDLPADVALLSSGIVIDENDLNVLSQRYHNNYTVQRVLSDYAQRNQVIYAPAPTAEMKIKSMGELAGFVKGAQDHGYAAMFIQTDDALADYLAGYESILGDGSELPTLTSATDSTASNATA